MLAIKGTLFSYIIETLNWQINLLKHIKNIGFPRHLLHLFLQLHLSLPRDPFLITAPFDKILDSQLLRSLLDPLQISTEITEVSGGLVVPILAHL